jgi:hypothetical protein
MSRPCRADFDIVERGKGAQTPPPRPTPHSPLPAQKEERLTDADHFRIMKQASVASLRW